MKATRKCSFCGKSFVTRSGMQRYCSEACQAEAKRARVMQKNNLFKVAQPLMEIQHQEYLTFSKAAILMGCSRQYIYKLVAIGKLKASRISNRMAFIRRADIEQMLEGNPYHRILPGNTSTPRKSSSSSLPAKREKREKESEEVLDFYSGEEVALVGDANTALQYSLLLSNYCKKVYVCTWMDRFFGDKALSDALLEKENVVWIKNVNLTAFEGGEELSACVFDNRETGEKLVLPVKACFVAIGQQPDNEAFKNLVTLDKDGYVVAGEDCLTDTEGVFVAGDCRTKSVRQLTTAAADGAIAAMAACKYLK